MKSFTSISIVSLVFVICLSCGSISFCVMRNTLDVVLTENSPRISIYEKDSISIKSMSYITPNVDGIDDMYELELSDACLDLLEGDDSNWCIFTIRDKCSDVFTGGYPEADYETFWEPDDAPTGRYFVDISISVEDRISIDTTVYLELHR